MNMENKYFTPDIEDVYIGYEHETYSIGLQMINGRFLPDNERDDELKWRPNIIKCGSDILNLEASSYPNEDEPYKSFKTLWKDYIRVPYLTKEQIEAEGWKHSEKDCFDYNDRWMCSWYPEHNRMEFCDDENENNFAGECKDINTFRKITKLLKIN